MTLFTHYNRYLRSNHPTRSPMKPYLNAQQKNYSIYCSLLRRILKEQPNIPGNLIRIENALQRDSPIATEPTIIFRTTGRGEYCLCDVEGCTEITRAKKWRLVPCPLRLVKGSIRWCRRSGCKGCRGGRRRARWLRFRLPWCCLACRRPRSLTLRRWNPGRRVC